MGQGFVASDVRPVGFSFSSGCFMPSTNTLSPHLWSTDDVHPYSSLVLIGQALVSEAISIIQAGVSQLYMLLWTLTASSSYVDSRKKGDKSKMAMADPNHTSNLGRGRWYPLLTAKPIDASM